MLSSQKCNVTNHGFALIFYSLIGGYHLFNETGEFLTISSKREGIRA